MTDAPPTTFTSHNIRLADGTQTLPDKGHTMDEHPLTLSVKRLLTCLYPQGLQGKTLIDVGCLEGGFTTAFARMGLTATGIEVRDSNYQNCLYVRDRVALPNLSFVQGDAMDVDRYGPFDIFFVSGLLYHLDRPRAFLEAVGRNCGKVLVIWTTITQAERNAAAEHFSLSELAENEGLHGRWYSEHEGPPRDELNQLKWASWDNRRSFWLQKEFLLELLRDVGFDLVFEQFDSLDDIVGEMTEGFYRQLDRVVLVAMKSGLPREESQPRRREPPREVHRVDPFTARALAEAQERAAQAEAALNAVHASTSWRITAPLRRLGRLF